MPGIPDNVHSHTAPNPPRNSAFISYSHEDRGYLQELQAQLTHYIRKGNLDVWDDTKIRPGTSRLEETNKALQFAKVAVLLVSPDFFASERIVENELPLLLAAARKEEVIIFCVILRSCAFEDSELAQFYPVNAPDKPLGIMTRAQRDKVWSQVAELVWKTVSEGKEESVTKREATLGTTENPQLSYPKNISAPHITSQRGHNVAPSFTSGAIASKRVKDSTHPTCDICIICAMEEEVEVFIHETSRLCCVTFQAASGSHTKREYRYATIQNNEQEPLTIYVTWPPSYGPEETGLHLKSVLDELEPRFAAMTGICAGDKKKVALGDIIVAERAFRYDTGKIVLDRRGRKKQLYDVGTRNPHPNILQFVRMFDAWKSAVAELKRPISKHQQRDWLLSRLLQEATPLVDAIPLKELEQHAPNWKKLVYELQSSSHRYLNDDRALCNPAQVQELYFGKDDFPFQDPAQPRRYIAPMASGSFVRSDNPFEDIQGPVRGTIAIDMEGTTFYRTVADFPKIHSLLVKGVCDYADPDKDDSYHEYAATVSTIYMLCLIKAYVTNSRISKL